MQGALIGTVVVARRIYDAVRPHQVRVALERVVAVYALPDSSPKPSTAPVPGPMHALRVSLSRPIGLIAHTRLVTLSSRRHVSGIGS